MRIAYNPKTAEALVSAPNNEDITFDLSGLAIYAKGVKFEGKVYSVFKKHTLNTTGGYDGLVPAPSYTTTTTRYLREDGTWVVPTNYYRPISVDGTSILENDNTALNLVAGANISIIAENSSGYTGKVTITNTGVRSTIINGNYLRIDTNGTNTDLTIPYASTAALLAKQGGTDTSTSVWNPQTSWTKVWGQSFTDSSISSDTGDILYYLRAGEYSSENTELCVVIDGDYYAGTGQYKVWHAGNLTKVSQLDNDSGFLTSLPSHTHSYLTAYGEGDLAATRTADYTVALCTGGWASSLAGYGSTYGTTLDVSGYSTWYHRLAFRTDGQIEYWQGINTKTMSSLGILAFTSNIPTVTDYYWANVKISASSDVYTTPQFGGVTIYDGTNSCLYLKTTTAGAYAYLAAYNTGGRYGADVVLHSGSALVLGAGESAANMYSNNVDSLQGSENLYLTADGAVTVYTNCDTIANRKHVATFNTDGSFNVHGPINVNGGSDLNLRAPSSDNNPGDLVFTNSSGTELARLWKAYAVNDLMVRFGSSDPSKTVLHSGNYSSFIDSYYIPSQSMMNSAYATIPTYNGETGWHRIATIKDGDYGYGSYILYLCGSWNLVPNTNAIIHINTMHTTVQLTQVSGIVGYVNKIRLVNVSGNEYYIDVHINYTEDKTPGTVHCYFLGNGTITPRITVEKITSSVTASAELTLADGGFSHASLALKDSNDGKNITACYSTGGFSSNPSWLAAWNGYHLTYVSPSVLSVNYANSAGSIGGYNISNFMVYANHPDYVTASFTDENLSKKAGEKYIEYWDSAGWFNSAWGQVTANYGFVGNLTGTASYADSAGISDYLKIHDIRDNNYAPNSTSWPLFNIRAWFNNTGTPNGDWWSGITVKGWSNDYNVWLLASTATNHSYANFGLFFRTGNGSSWTNWKNVVTSESVNNIVVTSSLPATKVNNTIYILV